MNFKLWRSSVLVIISVLFVSGLRAQEDNSLNDPDLKDLLKQAAEMQKKAGELQKNPASLDTRTKLAEMEAVAKEEAARQEQEEKQEKEKLQATLKKQLEAPGPVTLPDWTPATPEFKAAGAPVRKIEDDEVKIVQIGTSSLTPEKIVDSWQAAANAASNLNQSLANMRQYDAISIFEDGDAPLLFGKIGTTSKGMLFPVRSIEMGKRHLG